MYPWSLDSTFEFIPFCSGTPFLFMHFSYTSVSFDDFPFELSKVMCNIGFWMNETIRRIIGISFLFFGNLQSLQRNLVHLVFHNFFPGQHRIILHPGDTAIFSTYFGVKILQQLSNVVTGHLSSESLKRKMRIRHVQEGLRKYPIVSPQLVQQRYAVKDTTLGPYDIPKGTTSTTHPCPPPLPPNTQGK